VFRLTSRDRAPARDALGLPENRRLFCIFRQVPGALEVFSLCGVI
jgi:hypothetical protein